MGADALAPPGAAAQTAQPPVAVYPIAGTKYNLPATQIAFRGIPAAQLGQVTVVGSATGAHAGQIEADSDGDGGSFLPARPFKPGETVTVTTGLNIVGGSHGRFGFKIATDPQLIPYGALIRTTDSSGAVQRFHSRPDLQPASLTITEDRAPASEGDIFLAPQYGPLQNGPMIIDPDGRLVWFLPYPEQENTMVTDFRVQNLYGQPVLTWWQGNTNAGHGRGVGMIYNSDYQQIATVRAGNGLDMGLHEFLVTPQGDAYINCTSLVHVPGIRQPVVDSVIQEIDIKTGLVLFEWHALDHIALSDSFFFTPKTSGRYFEAYHANSVALDSDGNLIISVRDTWAIYKVNRETGQIMWTLGGKHSSFKMGRGTTTAFQHDAIVQPDGTITIMDDGAGPPAIHPYSRGIRVALNLRTMTATLVKEYDHSPNISTEFEGNVQQLSDGNVFLGWGQQPYFSEDNASGQQIFDGHFIVPASSYRAYRFPWSAQPPTLPAIAVGPGSAGGTDVWASWNGATDVASWRLLAGPSPSSLTAVWSDPVSGFETTLAVPSQAPYYQVQALGSSGAVLATSPAAAAPSHLVLYGRSAFVSNDAAGGLPAGCFTTQSCHITTSVYSGRTLIARTGAEQIGMGGDGILHFALNSTGRGLLARARGNRLPVTVTARDSSGVSAGASVNLISVTTHGAGPPRTITQSSTLQIAGTTDYVSQGGTGGILAGCYATVPCLVSTTISSGGTVIAQTKPELLGESQLGYLAFSLTAAGRSMLARAPGNQLGAQVVLTGGGATATDSVALVRFR